MFRVLRTLFLLLVTVGALAAVFGVIAVVGVARLTTSLPAAAAVTDVAATQPVTTMPADTVAIVPVVAEGGKVADSVKATPVDPARIVLNAADARLHGSLIRRDGDTHDIIGWSRADDWLDWPIETSPGALHAFHVDVTYACGAGAGGGFSIEVADQKVAGKTEPTASWAEFRTVRLGTIQVPGGKNQLCVKPAPGLQHDLMRLRRVDLVAPIPGEALAAGPAPGEKGDGSLVNVAERGRTLIMLRAEEATLHGDGIHVEQVDGGLDIGYWSRSDQTAEWAVPRGRRGKFNVLLSYAADNDAGGGDFELSVGEQKLTGHAEPTGGWQKYRDLNLGTVTLERGKEGKVVVIKPTRIDNGRSLMNLRQIQLSPAE